MTIPPHVCVSCGVILSRSVGPRAGAFRQPAPSSPLRDRPTAATRPDRNLHVIYGDSVECFAVLRITMSGVERQMGPEPIAAKYGSAKLKSSQEANKRICLVNIVQSFVSRVDACPRGLQQHRTLDALGCSFVCKFPL